jgi:hypothetical protein
MKWILTVNMNHKKRVTHASTRISMSLGDAAPWMYLVNKQANKYSGEKPRETFTSCLMIPPKRPTEKKQKQADF